MKPILSYEIRPFKMRPLLGPLQGIPAETMSGGTLKKLSDAREFRVWHHPKKGNEYYYEFTDPIEAKKHIEKTKDVIDFVAVIWDKRYEHYREVVIPKKLMKVI